MVTSCSDSSCNKHYEDFRRFVNLLIYDRTKRLRYRPHATSASNKIPEIYNSYIRVMHGCKYTYMQYGGRLSQLGGQSN